MFKKFLEKGALGNYYFSCDFIPTIENRDFWNSFPGELCVERAEADIDYAWPIIRATDFMKFKANGNRTDMEKINFERRRKLRDFVFAELYENRGHFLPQIVDGIFAICEESYWGLSAHWYKETKNIPTSAEPYIDLYVAETSSNLAVIYRALYTPLREYCPEILERIEYEVRRRIFEPYLAHTDYKWMGYGGRCNNWVPWIMSNLLTTFLVLEKDREELETALSKLCLESGHYYDFLNDDGGCDEGPNYWGHAGGMLFEFCYQLKLATGGEIDLFDDEKLKRIAAYLKKVHIAGDKFVNFADAHAKGLSDLTVILYGFGRETDQSELMNFAAAVFCDSTELEQRERAILCGQLNMRRILFSFEFINEMKKYPYNYPLHEGIEYLPDLQIAAIRNGELILCAKGGDNHEGHNHNDVGSFVFYDGLTPILIDVGIDTYTRFTFDKKYRYDKVRWTQSIYHNLPLVNGVAERYGSEFFADSFSAEDDRINVSFASAYPDEAGINELYREALLSDKGISITDSFEFAEKGRESITEHLMSILPVKVCDGYAMLGDGYRLTVCGGEISAEYIPFEDARLESDWKCDGVWRIAVTAEHEKKIKMAVEKIDGQRR